ncbi:energy transducer TonB [Alteromonas sp. ASW11-36]|uniref:Energy transducer TonB n=1 Tax=Alteromonas arenosi TaxID=3055817 RepID=A0ABT7SUF0_9ALTE|nr:energy transducer TonB [Alteromonas sp. ASW11-36]MDM7859825.1 energy transducer TonB [Alteromonas sp. ASW11-36]
MKSVFIDQLEQISDRTYSLRFVLLLMFGIAIAGGLTLFMHVLIEASHKELDQSVRANMLDFVRVKREESSAHNRRKPTKPEQQQAPPAPPSPQSEQQDLGDGALEVAVPTVDTGMNVDVGGIGVGQGDGEYLPIVKVAPAYPIKASMEGLEGTCLVQFTVTVTGSTKDVESVPGQCHRYFVRSSVEAAKKFKYKPRIIDGEPIEVPNVRNLFNYYLDQRDEQ